MVVWSVALGQNIIPLDNTPLAVMSMCLIKTVSCVQVLALKCINYIHFTTIGWVLLTCAVVFCCCFCVCGLGG